MKTNWWALSLKVGALFTALWGGGLYAQEPANRTDRPWLQGLPIAELSLKLPGARVPQLNRDCELPAGFEAIEEARGTGPYSDARYIGWLKQFYRCEYRDLETSLEANLVSADRHPFAAAFWAAIKWQEGNLGADWATGLSPALLEGLGKTPDLFRIYEESKTTPAQYAFVQSLSETDVAGRLWAKQFREWITTDVEGVDVETRSERLKRNPESFVNWWNMDRREKAALDALEQLVAPGGALEDHFFAPKFVEARLQGIDDIQNRLALVDLWLEKYPNDALALRRKSSELNALKRSEQAAKVGRRGALLAPFNSYRSAAQYAMQADDFEGADEILTLGAETSEQKLENYVSELEDAGYSHQARATAKRMIADGVGVETARDVLRESYDKAGQTALALEQARAVWETGEPNWIDARNYIKALRKDGLAREALAQFDAASAKLGQPDWGMIWEALRAAETVKDTQRSRDLLALAERLPVDPILVMREKITLHERLEEHAQVVGVARKLLSQWQGYRAQHRSLYKAAYALQELNGFNEAFAWASANSLNRTDAYYGAVEELNALGERARSSEIIELAKAEFPNRFFPLYLAQSRDGDPVDRADAERRINAIVNALPSFKGGDREWSVRSLVYQARLAAQKRLILLSELKRYSQYFEQYRPEMDLGRAQTSARFHYAATGEVEKAAEIWREYARNTVHIDNHVSRLRMQDDKRGKDAFRATWRSLSADRFDADRLQDAMHAHSRWGGSSIFAVCLGEWADENFPEALPTIRRRREEARSTFGGDEDFFRRRYATSGSLGASERYIGWYQGTKSRALEGGKFVDFDCDRGVVTTVDRDGRMRVRQEDYRSGKLLLLAEGAAWLRYEYNEDANVTRVASSDGREIRLIYNEAGKIVTLTDSETGSLDFEYSPLGKPTVISIEGLGRLEVDYDERGEITSTRPVNADGSTEGGQNLALRITRAFQNLLQLVKPESAERLLNKPAPEIEELVDRVIYGDAGVDAPGNVDAVAIALKRVRENNQTSSRTMQDIDSLAQDLAGEPLARAPAADFAAFGTALYALYTDVSPFGLPRNRWSIWSDFLKLAEARAGETAIARMLAGIRRDPLAPMIDQTAVNLADLRNPGFWYVDTPGAFLPSSLRSNVAYSAVLRRANGDLLAASNKGLLVERKGVWQRYSFDAASNSWARDDLAELSNDPIEVTSFAEISESALAIGTNRGVFLVGEGYDATIGRAGSGAGGLADGAVNALLATDGALYVGSAGGLSRIEITPEARFGSIEALGPMSVKNLKAGPDNSAIAAGEDGVWRVAGGEVSAIASMSADDAALAIEDGRVLIIARNKLYSVQRGESGWSSPVELTHAASAQLGAGGFGLAAIELDGTRTVAALGEDGYAVWQNGYFEHFALPYSDNRPAALAATLSRAGGLVAGADGALYRFEPGRVATLGGRAIYASAYDAQNDLTYFANGSRIQVALSREAGAEPEILNFDYVSARFLDMAPDGSLIAHDGNTVLRYPPGSRQEQVLFEAKAFCPEDYPCNQRLAGLLAASDGSVWATAGASAFRWKDGEVTEYSWFKDPVAFPIKSHWISRVVELPDGAIVVSASHEGHLDYQGETMSGQNLVYRDGAFQKFTRGALFTSATPVEGGAILGSTAGFYEANELGVRGLWASKEKSYMALYDRHPNIFLGGEGARIGNDTLLFPTPAGIAAYQSGNWFYPERLNWQYPDSSKADIGSRHTYTLEVDRAGRIYAGTDAGLVIFQQRGGDAVEFLMENAKPNLAFASYERTKLRKQASALVQGIDPDKPQFAAYAKVVKARDELEQAALVSVDEAERPRRSQTASGSDPGDIETGSHLGPKPGSRLADELRRKEREYTRLLAELERDDPGLAQLVTIQPLELAAMQEKLPEDAVIVQYIPQDGTLHIHVVGKDVSHVEQVDIDFDELMTSAILANYFLEDIAPAAEALVNKGNSIFAASEAEDELPKDSADGDLAGLYETLIAPIETQLEGFDRVYISAAGSLNYVPFAALTRVRGDKREYAVERYNMAMIPTSYLLSLVMDDTGGGQDMALIYGNPDGTLPYAEQEAASVQSQVSARMTDVIMRTGNAATMATLQEFGGRSGLLHLATHGNLDPVKPERSHLILGGDSTRLEAVDIMTLDLTDAELVFLSACETGRGGEGLEFATLARAFSHAGVPTTIASLWKVGDQSTLKLVDSFYDQYNSDAVKALSAAQREMINSNGPMSHPSTWAAFQVYGRGFARSR